MPIVRDISWTLEATTTDSGLIVPMPAYQVGDLLLAFIQSDTGAPVVTSPSWTQVFTRSNTCSLTVLRRIVTGSNEPNTVTFAANVNETYNGAIVSIRDVDTVTPINTFNDTTQAAASKFQFQSITTTRDKCLLMYGWANSGVGVPSIIEGPVFGLLGADGTAESQGIGWGFQHFSGSTTTEVTGSCVATGAGVKAVIAINPPTASVPLIPTYCAKDNSVYIDPINGVTAYNSNAALAATADTIFGTILSGTTVADATVAAAADVGLNSFHSTGQLTTPSATVNWGGAALDLATANRINVSGKNVLVHTGPSTAGQIQRFPTAAASRKGIAVGMFSSGTNPGSPRFSSWYVHGNGTPWGQSRDVPLVINSANTTGYLSGTAGFDPLAVDTFGFWVSSAGVSTTVWQFYSLWMLDTTTLAGGTAVEPVDIAGFSQVASLGHERRSVIQQGANQALILQPVQFGNGGTNPIYLDFDATAIEFPRIHNLASKEINYCSADNVAGITYYAGPTDTIKHRNSVISSASPYHWQFHASTHASASYDFSGLQVIGAGLVTLRAAAPLTGTIFSLCGGIYHNSAGLEQCTFMSSSATGSLTTTDPSKITNCLFVSDGTGHAIQIMATGTFSFVGNTFTGFGADGTTNASLYNASSGSVTLNISGGVATPTVRNGTNSSTTINNNVTVTLTGLQNPSEIRVYNAGTAIEIAGSENVTGGTFNFSVGTSVEIDISILSLGYQNMRLLAYSATADASLPISQVVDRQYLNP